MIALFAERGTEIHIKKNWHSKQLILVYFCKWMMSVKLLCISITLKMFKRVM